MKVSSSSSTSHATSRLRVQNFRKVPRQLREEGEEEEEEHLPDEKLTNNCTEHEALHSAYSPTHSRVLWVDEDN